MVIVNGSRPQGCVGLHLQGHDTSVVRDRMRLCWARLPIPRRGTANGVQNKTSVASQLLFGAFSHAAPESIAATALSPPSRLPPAHTSNTIMPKSSAITMYLPCAGSVKQTASGRRWEARGGGGSDALAKPRDSALASQRVHCEIIHGGPPRHRIEQPARAVKAIGSEPESAARVVQRLALL